MPDERKKVRIQSLRELKNSGRKIACVTAYDAITGRWADTAGVHVVLIGDSLCSTALGLPNTLKMTLEWTIHHALAVSQTVKKALRVGDMPFLTYKISEEQALANAGRLVQEANVEAVKMEGGTELASIIERVVNAGIPVMGHIGLQPQSFHKQGGYRLQGQDEAGRQQLMHDARALAAAGVFALVLEKIPPDLAEVIQAEISVPTIGIGAGGGCDGQILVMADLLGMSSNMHQKLARSYANLHDDAIAALRMYIQDVQEGTFPAPENTYES
jgi:3-methyl-2-oxobutanoate hydroxymethyltransferase